MLLANGADPYFVDGGMTLFVRACRFDCLDVAILLVKSGTIDDAPEMNYNLTKLRYCSVIIQILHHIDCRNVEIEARKRKQQLQMIKGAMDY